MYDSYLTLKFVTGFAKTSLNGTGLKSNLQPDIKDTLMHCLETSCGYTWPGLLSQMAFCQHCKAVLVHYRGCRATGEH